MGEDSEGAAESFSKLRDTILALTNMKVDILDGDSYKSTYQILKEVAAEWDDISQMNQQGLLYTLGGARQANVLASIISNFDIAEEAMKAASDATGSAEHEQGIYLESLEGKVNQFKSAWQELSVDAFNTDFMKGFISAGTGVVKVLDAMAKSGTLLPTIIAGITAALQGLGKISLVVPIKNLDELGATMERTYTRVGRRTINSSNMQGNQLMNQLNWFGTGTLNDRLTRRQYNSILRANNMGTVGAYDFSKESEAIQAYNQAVAKLRDGTLQGAPAVTALNGALKNMSPELQKIATGMNGTVIASGQLSSTSQVAALNINALGASATTSAAKMVGLQMASMALSAAMSFGISLAISGIITLFDNFIHWSEKAQEKAQEVIDKFEQASTEIKDNIQSINDVRPEFETLAMGVDELGRNVSLSTEEYARYQEIVGQLIEMNPSLVEGYDAEGNALVNKNKALEESIRLEEDKLKLQRQQFLADGDTVLKGAQAKAFDARDALGRDMQKMAAQFGPFLWDQEGALALDRGDVDYFGGFQNARNQILQYLKDAKEAGRITEEQFGNAMRSLDEFAVHVQQFEGADDELKDYLLQYAANNEAYADLSEERQNIANKLIKGSKIDLEGSDKASIEDLQSQTDAVIALVGSMADISPFTQLTKLQEDIADGAIKVADAQKKIDSLSADIAAQTGKTTEEVKDTFGLTETEAELDRLEDRMGKLKRLFEGEGFESKIDSLSINELRSFDRLFGQLEQRYENLNDMPAHYAQAIADVFTSDYGMEEQISNLERFFDTVEKSQLSTGQIENVFRHISSSPDGWGNIDKEIKSLETFNQIVDSVGLTATENAGDIERLWNAFNGKNNTGMDVAGQLYYLDEAFQKGVINAEQYDAALSQLFATLGSASGINVSDVFESLKRSINPEELSKAISDTQMMLTGFYNAPVGNKASMTSQFEAQSKALEEMMNKALSAKDIGAYSDLSILSDQLASVMSQTTDPLGRLETIMDSVSTAFNNMNENGTIALETFQQLRALGPQFGNAMEASATGVVANKDALLDMVQAEANATKEHMEYLKNRDYNLLAQNAQEIQRLTQGSKDLASAKAQLTAEDARHLDALLAEQTTLQGLISTYDAMTDAIDRATGARAQLEAAMEAGSQTEVADIWKEGYEKAVEWLEAEQYGDVANILRTLLPEGYDLSSIEAIEAAMEQLGWLAGDTQTRIYTLYKAMADLTSQGSLDDLLSHAEIGPDGAVNLVLYAEEVEEVAKRLGVSTDLLRDHVTAAGAFSLGDGIGGVDQVISDLRNLEGVVSDVDGRVTVNMDALRQALSGKWKDSDINGLITTLAAAQDVDLTDAAGSVQNYLDVCQSVETSDYWQNQIQGVDELTNAISSLDKAQPNDLMAFINQLSVQAGKSKDEIAGIVKTLTDQDYQFTVNGELAGVEEIQGAIQGIEVTWDSVKANIESQGIQIDMDTDPAALAELAGSTDTLQHWLDLARESGDTVAQQRLTASIEYAESGDINGLIDSVKQGLEGLQKKLQEVFTIKMSGAWGINQAAPLIVRTKKVIDDLTAALKRIQSFKSKITIDYSSVKAARNAVNAYKSTLNSIPSTKTTTVVTNYKTTGYSSAAAAKKSGAVLNSDNASSRFAEGTRNARREKALVNDGAPVNGSAGELIIRKASNEAFIANQGRLAMVDLYPGDTVLTARETQEVLSGGSDVQFRRLASGLPNISSIKPPSSKPSSSSSKPSSSSGSSNKGSSSKPSTSSSKQSSSSSSSNEDSWKNAFEAEYKYYKYMLDMKYIAEAEYLDAVEALNIKYFQNREEYLDDWRQYEVEVFQGRLDNIKTLYDEEAQYLQYQLDMQMIKEEEYWNALEGLNETYYANQEHLQADYRSNQAEVFKARLDLARNAFDSEVKELDRNLKMELISEQEYWEKRNALAEKYYANNQYLTEEWKDEQVEALQAVWDLTESKYNDIVKKLERAQRESQWTNNKMSDAQLESAKINAAVMTLGRYDHFDEEMTDMRLDAREAQMEGLRKIYEDGKKELQRAVDSYKITAEAAKKAQQALFTLTLGREPEYFSEELADNAVERVQNFVDEITNTVEKGIKKLDNLLSLNKISQYQHDADAIKLKEEQYSKFPQAFQDEIENLEVDKYNAVIEQRKRALERAIKEIERRQELNEITDKQANELIHTVTRMLHSQNPEAFRDEDRDEEVRYYTQTHENITAEVEKQLTEFERLYRTGKMKYEDYRREVYKLQEFMYGDDIYWQDTMTDARTQWWEDQKEIAYQAYQEQVDINERMHDLALRDDEDYFQQKVLLYQQYLAHDDRFYEEALKTQVELHKEAVNLAKDRYSRELSLLENSHKLGLISTSEFYRQRQELAEKHLGGIKELEEDLANVYMQTYEDIKNLQTDYWERALSGVEYMVDKEIKLREKAQEAEIAPIEKAMRDLRKQQRDLQREQTAKKDEEEAATRPIDDEIYELQRKEKELTIRYKRLIRPYQDAQREKQKEQEKLQRAQELELRPLEKELHALDRQSTWIEKMYEDRLYPLQQELKMLQKIEEQKEEELAIEEARYKLAKAMTERPNLVYREGLGFVYEADRNAIREAQKAKNEVDNDSETQRRIKALEDEIERLEDARDQELHPIDDRSWWLNWWAEDVNDKYDNLLEPIEDWLYDMKQYLDDLDWENTLTLRPIQDRLEDLELMRADLDRMYELADREMQDALDVIQRQLDNMQDQLDDINDKYKAEIDNLNKMKEILSDQKEYWEHILDLQIAQKVFGEEAFQEFSAMLQQSNEEWNQALADRITGFSQLYEDLFALAGESLKDYEGCIDATFLHLNMGIDELLAKAESMRDMLSQAEYENILNQIKWQEAMNNWNATGQTPQLPNVPFDNIPTTQNRYPQQPSSSNPYLSDIDKPIDKPGDYIISTNPFVDTTPQKRPSQSQNTQSSTNLKKLDEAIGKISSLTSALNAAKTAVANGQGGASDVLKVTREIDAFIQATKSFAMDMRSNGTQAEIGKAVSILTGLATLSKLIMKDFGSYARGRSGGPAEFAWTQEAGPEAIMRTSKGAFTFLAPNDMVFSSKQTRNLWKLSQAEPSTVLSPDKNNVPKVYTQQTENVTYKVSIGDVVIQHADNAEDLSRQIVNRFGNQLAQELSRR